jgi:bacterioferritin-associated ferredoxin
LVLKEASKRQELLAVLDSVIERAYQAYSNKYTQSNQRISWGRLIAHCCRAAAEILRDQDLEDLVGRVEGLEKALNR